VRGGDDPTDPMAVKLVPRLRAALGDEGYDRAARRGRALSRAEAIKHLDPEGI